MDQPLPLLEQGQLKIAMGMLKLLTDDGRALEKPYTIILFL